MDIFIELWENILRSTFSGIISIIGIWFYMIIILGTALYRIKKGDHMN